MLSAHSSSNMFMNSYTKKNHTYTHLSHFLAFSLLCFVCACIFLFLCLCLCVHVYAYASAPCLLFNLRFIHSSHVFKPYMRKYLSMDYIYKWTVCSCSQWLHIVWRIFVIFILPFVKLARFVTKYLVIENWHSRGTWIIYLIWLNWFVQMFNTNTDINSMSLCTKGNQTSLLQTRLHSKILKSYTHFRTRWQIDNGMFFKIFFGEFCSAALYLPSLFAWNLVLHMSYSSRSSFLCSSFI